MAAGSYDDERLSDFRCARARDEATVGLARSSGLLSLLERIGLRRAHIVDFGGGTGDLGVDLIKERPEDRFTVVELPSMIVRMRQKRPQIEFSGTLPDSCDVFYSSGTIQYLSDPQSVMEHAFKSARHAVIFARNSFSPFELFRVQRSRLFWNGSGEIPQGFEDHLIAFPHRTIKVRSITNAASARGFRLIERSRDRSGILPYFGLVSGGKILFLRAS